MDKINRDYMDKNAITEMSKAFKSNKQLPSIQLNDFFMTNSYDEFCKDMKKMSYSKDSSVMKHSYTSASMPSSLKRVFRSREFLRLLSGITGKRVKKADAKIIAMSWKDYKLLHDEELEKPGYDFFIDFTEDWNDDFGGSLVYVDGTGEYTKIQPKGNNLIVVQRKRNVHKFIQYLNHLSKRNKRILVIGKFS